MKKITFLFALLCASVMGWAQVTYSGTETNAAANVDWSITWNAAGTLTFNASWDQTLPGVNPQVAINNAFNNMSRDGNSASFTTTAEYNENDPLSIHFHLPYEAGGLIQFDISYNVGQTNGGSEPTGLCGLTTYDSNIGAEDPYKIKLTSIKIDDVFYVRVESTKEGASIQRVFTDNIWCSTSNGNLQLGIAANHRVIGGKLYFIIPSTSVPTIYTGDGVYVHYADGADRAYPSTYNVPLTACSDAIDYGVDLISPSITAASLVSNTSAQAVISITATDNVGVTACAVYDGTAHLGDYPVSEGQFTVTELMYNHAYTLTIKAKDAMGNISANSVNVSVTTDDNTDIIDDSEAVSQGNVALSSAGSSATATTGNAGLAIDGNGEGGSRWESSASDPQVWTLDMGQQRVFDNVQIRWEGAYAKTYTLAISDDNTNWTTIHYVKGQSLAGFPYEQSIDLPQLKARYIRFYGIERGTGYGYSFYEFRVYKKDTPVLTTIIASIVNDKHYYQVGVDAATIALEFKDQFNEDIAHGAVTYNISPDASYGSVSEGVFTPSKVGTISITAQVGSVVSNAVSLRATSSADLAYNKLHSASTGETVLDERPAANAVDNDEGTEWQSHAGTADTEEARTYDAWLIVNLGDKYDVDLVAVKFEGACSQAYTIEFTDDLEHAWKTGASYSGAAGTNARRDEHSALTNNTAVQYVRFFSTKAATQYGMKVQELRVFGAVAASPTKTVSALVNNPAMGTATVTQGGNPASEVTTGSTVTFSAEANEGYIFVEWSNGEKRATFDTEVNSNMELTANFRALNHISCNEEMTNGDYTAYVTYRKTANENEYEFIVRSAKTMTGFSNVYIGHINGNNEVNLNGNGSLTNNGHTLSYTFTSTTEPKLNSPLYVNFANHGEVTFNQINGGTTFEFAVACDDAVAESISLNMSETAIDLDATKTLVVTFDPVYTADQSITWTTTNSSVASVDNGVVTANAIGTATITAESANGKTATCAVTVEAISEKTCWGVGNDFTYQANTVSYYYSITRNTDKTLTYTAEFSRDVTGLGVQVNVHNNAEYSTMSYDSGSKTASFTTTETFETDEYLHGFFYFGGNRTDYYYTVGSVCAKPGVDVTGVDINHTSLELTIDEHATVTASVVPANADDKEIIWTNSNPSVASFNTATGEVVALTVGTTTITAKSHFDESIFATCVVEVIDELTPVTWHGFGTFTPQEGLTGFTYSITRNANRSLTYTIVLDKNPLGFVGEVNIKDDGTYSPMSYNATTRTATYTTAEDYALDGDVLNKSFWWLKYDGGGVDRVNFSYTVGSENEAIAQAVGLDDTKDNSAVIERFDEQPAIAVINRTFTAPNEWYTICLPFDLDNDQLVDAFGAGYTLAKLVESEDRGSLIHLNFDNANALEAGKAYLVQVASAVSVAPTFHNVTIKNVDPATLKSTCADMYFQGTFTNLTLTGEDKRFVGEENYLYAPNPDGGTPMGAFRCFFTIRDGSSASAPGKRAKIVFGRQSPTGVDQISEQAAPAKFMLDGVLYIIRDGRTYNAQGMLIQ